MLGYIRPVNDGDLFARLDQAGPFDGPVELPAPKAADSTRLRPHPLGPEALREVQRDLGAPNYWSRHWMPR